MASSTSSLTARVAVAIAALALAPVAARATGAERARTDARVREAARAKLVEGVALLKQSDYVHALTKFEEAYALVPSPKIHYDLGLAYVGLGRSAEALESFERFLAEAPDAPADTRKKAGHNCDVLRPRVAAVTVSTDAEGVELLIDGRKRGVTPLPRPIYIEPGSHQIAAQPARGGPGPSEDVAVAAGATLALTLRVGEAKAATSSPSIVIGLSPAAAGGAPQTAPASPPPPEPSNTRRAFAVSTTALGVALLGAGLTFGLLARRESQQLSSDSQATDGPVVFDVSKESRGQRYETLEIVSLGVGAVALVTGAALLATSRHRARVEPLASSSAAGARLRVSF